MIQKAMRYSDNKYEILNKVNTIASSTFKLIRHEEGEYYLNEKGTPFRLIAFPGRDAICVEYADNEELARKSVFAEDGDLFYIDDYDDIKTIWNDIASEITEE